MSDVYLIYYGKPITEKQWTSHCEGKIDLKKKLKIKVSKRERFEEKKRVIPLHPRTGQTTLSKQLFSSNQPLSK